MHNAQIPPGVIAIIPLAVIVLIVLALAKWGHAQMWELLLTLLLGVVLSGTVLGPSIHQILSQLSGGRLR